MISQQPGFTVLSAPVALCDRRALSQAWFSALHMHTQNAQAPAAVRATARAQRVAPSLAQSIKTTGGIARTACVQTPPQRYSGTATPVPATVDRRHTPSKLARKIEQAFLREQNAPKQASFALEGDRGRVQILLRSAGGATQIVALCPPAAREVVSQALAQARYALSMRGIALQTDVRGFAQ